MVNNYIPNSDLAFIIGDGGLSRASPAPTKVAGEKVNSCLELQSTTRADIFLKPKTDVQIAAIPNPTAGMIAFSSDSNAIVVRDNTAWNPLIPPSPPVPSSILFTSVNLDTNDIINMGSGGFPFAPEILPAPGAGLMYVIHGIMFILFDTDADWDPSATPGVRAFYNFDAGPGGFNDAASTLIPEDFFSLESETAFNRAFYVTGNDDTLITPDNFSNKGICLSSVPPFGLTFISGSPTARADIWYSIVPYP